ncbi:MAG: hypothetical protein ACODAD_06415 [Planctomycetota bacterium]
MVELIQQYLEALRKARREPGAESELERIYMEVLRVDPNHPLAKLHELMAEGVSFNITEQVRALLAEEITSLNQTSNDQNAE